MKQKQNVLRKQNVILDDRHKIQIKTFLGPNITKDACILVFIEAERLRSVYVW